MVLLTISLFVYLTSGSQAWFFSITEIYLPFRTIFCIFHFLDSLISLPLIFPKHLLCSFVNFISQVLYFEGFFKFKLFWNLFYSLLLLLLGHNVWYIIAFSEDVNFSISGYFFLLLLYFNLFYLSWGFCWNLPQSLMSRITRRVNTQWILQVLSIRVSFLKGWQNRKYMAEFSPKFLQKLLPSSMPSIFFLSSG